MKFSFHASPNYRGSKSTKEIMMDVTICLLAVLTFSTVWYGVSYGVSYAIRVVCMSVIAVLSALATEACFFKLSGKEVVPNLKKSFGWITALIIVCLTSINVSYYAVAVSTVIALVFGKLVFGGFGQNVFNPAAFGEAIIMNSFANSTAADFATSATPLTSMQSAGWVMDGTAFAAFMKSFGGIAGLFTGNYAAVIGSTSAILILLCGAFLIWREDINWRIPACYLGSVAIMSLLAGLFNGNGVWFLLFNLLSGGILFCAFFMLTDPVTAPVSICGKYIYSVGAAMLTLLIRWKANYPDGALYAILLMNMLTPAIEMALRGSQIKDIKKMTQITLISTVVCLIVGVAVGATLSTKAEETTSAPAVTETTDTNETTEESAGISLSDDFSANEASCELQDGAYACAAKGFGLINNMGDEYAENEVKVTVEGGKVVKVELVNFGDTKGIGDTAVSDTALAAYEGLTAEDSVDAVSGATFTSTSIASMVAAALAAAE